MELGRITLQLTSGALGLWLQWPGPFEQTYVPVYAQITNVVVQYQPRNLGCPAH